MEYDLYIENNNINYTTRTRNCARAKENFFGGKNRKRQFLAEENAGKAGARRAKEGLNLVNSLRLW